MDNSETLSECYETLYEETLPSLGTEDPLLTRIISARLLIERVGERDANYWWDSQVLSSFGQDTLEETVPRTATRAQIELAMKVGKKVENEAIDSQFVSLFDLGPFVESQIQREITKIERSDELDVLKEQPVEIIETGWTDPLVEREIEKSAGKNRSGKIGVISTEELQEKDVLGDVVSQLIHGYGEATKQDLNIPYFSVKQ